jgi:TFIIF-interacting CTD phosphatase-like protein
MGDNILVLDVDETMLNMEPLSYLKIFKKNYADYEGITTEFFGKGYYISPRPKLMECLSKARQFSRLVAFSIVHKEITEMKLNALGLKGFFTAIYGKEDLLNGKKSLKKISEDFGIDGNNIIAIDNDSSAYVENSVIKVKPFFIGCDHEYEFKDYPDNLFRAIRKASEIFQGIKVVPPILQER